jgi:siroheme synthase-like protein
VKPYPIFLVGLEQRRCVVIGGGGEAERKVDGLLDCDAAVRLIAPEITPRLRELAGSRRLSWEPRTYRGGDLAGAFLVIVTETDPQVVERAWIEAQARGIPINALDDVEHCSFIAGSVVRRGALTVAISTSGCAPALAVRLRERMEREFGPEYAEFLELAEGLREPLARQVGDFRARREAWYRLVDSDVLDLLRAGRREQARERAVEILALLDSATLL